MSVLHSLVLGVLQGFTEFLPVSSSGHLVVAQGLIPSFRDSAVAFDILLHGGTLLSVVVYFRRKIFSIASSAFSGEREGIRLLLLLLVGTIPVVLLGFFLRELVGKLFSSPRIVPPLWILMGLLLLAVDRVSNGERNQARTGVLDILVVGLAQAVALLPGISRSGTTISAGIFRGLDRRWAAEFSFLLSIPAILGALTLEAKEILSLSSGSLPAYLAGAAAAFLSGLAAIGILMRLVVTRRLRYFGYYCFTAAFCGTVLLLLF